MTGFQSKQRSAQEIEIAELKNSLALARQKKTLRDEFALVALNGLLSAIPMETEFHVKEISASCYKFADAMMKERMK
jgi:hypothetical protein